MRIYRRILRKESRFIKAMHPTLLHKAVITVYGTAFTIITEIDNVSESNGVPNFKAFILGCWVNFFDVASTLVADGY